MSVLRAWFKDKINVVCMLGLFALWWLTDRWDELSE